MNMTGHVSRRVTSYGMAGAFALALASGRCARPIASPADAPSPFARRDTTSLLGELTARPDRTTTSGFTPPPTHVVHLAFDVLRADLPIESVRHSRKIWNHVDQLCIEPERVVRLEQNGIRVGLASSDSWAPIRTILQACNARTQQNRIVVQNGLPLTIAIGTVEKGESIFTYTPQGRLIGQTFQGGQKMVLVDYLFHSDLGGMTDLRLALEVRRSRGTVTWERLGDVIRQVPAYDRHVFSDLGVLLTVRPSEFVVIGAGDKAENAYLVGGRFFTSQASSGEALETMFFITPQPYRTEADLRPS